MAKQRTQQQPSSTDPNGSSKKSVTPPKGRPTRPRSGSGPRKRAFGPVAQWITVALLLALVVVVLMLITDGGDFNPFDDDEQIPSQFGAAVVAEPSPG